VDKLKSNAAQGRLFDLADAISIRRGMAATPLNLLVELSASINIHDVDLQSPPQNQCYSSHSKAAFHA